MTIEELLDLGLENWTFDTVQAIVSNHEFEPGQFDFKEVLNPEKGNEDARKQHLDHLRKTTCSLANSAGGLIIFGVKDPRSQKPPLAIDDLIVGIPLGSDLRKQFGDKLKPIQQDVFFEASPSPIRLPTDAKRGVFVVYVPQSRRRPHMVVDGQQNTFYRRSEGGSAIPMNVYEVQEQMLYTEERLRKVTLLRLKIAQYQNLIVQLLSVSNTPTQIVYRFDTGAFEPLVADVCGLLPAGNNLLQNLLIIPVAASSVNNMIDRASSPWFTSGDGRTKDEVYKDIIRDVAKTRSYLCRV